MKKYIYLLIILCNISILSQSIKIEVSNLPNQTAKLYSLSGEKINFIDSSLSSQNIFTYQIKGEMGFYKIVFDKNKSIDFIFDDEEIEIETDANSVFDSLKIIKSESNKIYYDFISLNKDYKTKSELLNLILLRYPSEDDFYQATKNKLKQIQEEYNYFVNVTSQENPNSFIAMYIKSAQLPIIDSNISNEKRLDYLKSHSLDNVNFNNALLINSDVFTYKSIEYLTYYRNPQLPKELLEKEFIKAVDTLLNKAKINQLVYQHITEYLLDGFKKFGFDKIIDYIIDNYVIADDLCLDEETENSIQKRIDQLKLLTIGTEAPNFILTDNEGNVIDLSKIKAEKILLVFYSTQCPHCQILLPKLSTLKKERKNLKIIAVSLDYNKNEWIEFLDENKIDLININDSKGWEGEFAKRFYIYATPTMFLIDSEKKIIGKPITFLELIKLI